MNNKLEKLNVKETITSLELCKIINEMREEVYNYKLDNNVELDKVEIKNGKYTELQHKTLLRIIRDEFEFEISEKLRSIENRDLEHEQNILLMQEVNKNDISEDYEQDLFRQSFLLEIDGNILQQLYNEINIGNGAKRNSVIIILGLDLAKQILIRESSLVRRKVMKYIKDLEEQNRQLKEALIHKDYSNWLLTRKEGKIVRRELTDGIQKLIVYAKEQGSKSADKYYMIYSKLVNDLLLIESNSRDKLDILTLNKIAQLEDLISNIVLDGIEKGMYYKYIYQEVKKLTKEYMKFLNYDKGLLQPKQKELFLNMGINNEQ